MASNTSTDQHLTVIGDRAVLRFESFGEYLEWNAANDSRTGLSYFSSFNGCDSIQHAVQLGRTGLDDHGSKSLKLAEDAIRLVETELLDTRFHTFNSVEGAYVDIDAFLMGEPESMVQFEAAPVEMTEPIVTIVVATGVLGNVSTRELIERGSRVMALLDAIERTGMQAEIWSDATTRRDGTSKLGRVSVKLKAAGEPYDAGTLAFAMMSNAMHRGLGFNAKHGWPPAWRKALNVSVHGGMGSTAHGALRHPEDYPEGHLYIPALQSGRAEFSVEEALRELGLLASA